MSRPSLLRRAAIAVGTTTLLVPALLLGGAAPAAAETADLSTDEAGAAAGGYLARTLEANGGYIAGFDGVSPDFGSTSNAVLALVEAGVGSDQVDEAVTLLEQRAADYATPDGAGNPGALGYLMLVAGATGEDATDFGGVSLPAELDTIEQDAPDATDPGLYGDGDPTYDGVFRQSLGLLGLAAVGADPSEAAVHFLRRQQCADGSWTAYREDTDEPCADGAGEVDATAIATQALLALGEDPDVDPTAYLQDAQAADGGWQAFGTTNSNTTALAISALVALGEDVESAQYEGTIGSPYDVLQSLQVGCEATGAREAERGAFDYDGAHESPEANDFATVSAALSVQGGAYPVEQPVVPGDDSQPVLACGGTEGGLTAEGTDGLPRTGLDTAPLLALGLGAVGAGIAAVAASTRRRRSSAA